MNYEPLFFASRRFAPGCPDTLPSLIYLGLTFYLSHFTCFVASRLTGFTVWLFSLIGVLVGDVADDVEYRDKGIHYLGIEVFPSLLREGVEDP